MRSAARAAAAALLLAATACASFPENTITPKTGVKADYRYNALEATTNASVNDPRTLVLLAFSGGGVRASAMAFGVLEVLRETEVTIGGRKRRLLDEVDVISANSGGSYTAAYYGLFRERMFSDAPDPTDRFETAFLKRGFEGDILRAALNPINLARLLSPYYNRTDLAAEVLDREVFRGSTFKDLYARGRPFIILNSNDDTKGSRFQFTQDNFDWLCSDLSGFPVARAVMASSAAHGLFGPVRLRNYTAKHCVEPEWVELALEDLERQPRRYLDASPIRRYFRKECWDDSCEPDGTIEHFSFQNDGGTVDNLGLRSLIWALESTDPDMSFLELMNNRKIDRILLISVNAAADPDTSLERSRSGPGPLTLIQSAVNNAIDAVTYDSLEFAQGVFEEARKRRHPGAVYHKPVLIGFDHLEDRKDRHCFKSLGTRLTLPDRAIDEVRQAGRYLLARSPAFEAFVTAYGGVPPKQAKPTCTP